MQDAKEEIRARLSIEDVIGEYVQLKRAGRNFKGLSPFSGEKTPSFYVSPEKNIWHDFSSNKGGDVFSFVMEVEGLDFRGALELLARKAGVELASYDSASAQRRAREKQRLLEINELAARYFQQSLLKNQRALSYVFEQRQLSKEIVQQFRIGYAPDTGDAALVGLLRKKGYSSQEISQAGLTNRRGGDLFRARMMVPLMDPSGQVIGFTGRIIEADPSAPKYLNTPQTPLYDKGRHVFGLSQAKEAIRTGDYAVVVEGNLDVVSSHQAGVRQVVATAGTAMTDSHLKALSRLSGNVRLAFDADAAGIAATERAIPIAQRVGVELTIITLPDGAKDPDELIQQDVSLWERAIEQATPIVNWLFRQYSRREDLSTPLGKRRFTTAALEVVKSIQDAVERESYLRQIAQMTHTSLEALVEKLQSGVSQQDEPLKKVATQTIVDTDPYIHQDNLLALACAHDGVARGLGELQADMIVGEHRLAVYTYLLGNPSQLVDSPKDLQEFDTYVKILLLKADTRYGQWSDDDKLHEGARLIRLTKHEHRQTQKESLTSALRAAEDIGDEAEALRLRQELNALIKEMARAKNEEKR